MGEPDAITPHQIAESLLDRTGKAMDRGDFDEFADCFVYPREIETFTGKRLLANREDAREVFENVRLHYRSKGVTQVVRHCVDAAFEDEATIASTHETRLLRDNLLVQDPFVVLSTLIRTARGWKIGSTKYAIRDAPAHNTALSGPAARDIDEV